MYTFLKPLSVREELLRRQIRIFTPLEFSRIFRSAKSQTKYFLEKQTTKDGLFERLKKGLYSLRTDFPSEEEIANALYRPSYISFEYALAYYGMLPEMPHSITSATTKATRLFSAFDRTFTYCSIKNEAYMGYSLIKTKTKSFLIADKEKALVDYLYFQVLGKKPQNERLVLKNLNKDKLINYARLYQRESLSKVIKELC